MPHDTPGAAGPDAPLDWDALARYLAGEGSPAERANVRQWLASHAAEASTILALDTALAGLKISDDATRGIDVDAALASVNARRVVVSAPDTERVVPRQWTREARLPAAGRTWAWPLMAAAAVVLVAGSLLARRTRVAEQAPTIAARTFTTGIGGRDSLRLPDGTSVVMGPRSRLTLAAGYGQQARQIALEGEAFFDVTHDASRPFLIRASGATIRDLGTAFAVHADSMGAVRVAVRSGTVELEHAGAARTSMARLDAGDIGMIDSAGAVIAQRGAVTDDDLAWTRGTLIFRDATIADVRDDLRRWYGVELVASDAVLRRHLTATFGAGDPISAVLRTIALSLPATIERRGDSAIVRPAPETRQRR